MNINKNYFITFGVSLLVMIAIAVIVFMLMLPKQSSAAKGVVQDYQGISRSEYTFEATKQISSEPLKKKYSISSEDMTSFKSNNQYKTGNNDPFAETTTSTTSSSGNNTTNNNNNNGGNSSSNSNTNEQQEANNKTTNSNGGVANPPATSK